MRRVKVLLMAPLLVVRAWSMVGRERREVVVLVEDGACRLRKVEKARLVQSWVWGLMMSGVVSVGKGPVEAWVGLKIRWMRNP